MINISPYYSPDGLVKLDYIDIANAQKLKVIENIETKDLSSETIETENIETTTGNIETINTTTGNIETINSTLLYTDTATINTINSTSLYSMTGNITNANITNLNASNLSNSINGNSKNITNLNHINSSNGTITTLSTTNANITNLSSSLNGNSEDITNLNNITSSNGIINNLITTNLNASNLSNSINGNNKNITDLNNITSSNGTITTLNNTTANITNANITNLTSSINGNSKDLTNLNWVQSIEIDANYLGSVTDHILSIYTNYLDSNIIRVSNINNTTDIIFNNNLIPYNNNINIGSTDYKIKNIYSTNIITDNLTANNLNISSVTIPTINATTGNINYISSNMIDTANLRGVSGSNIILYNNIRPSTTETVYLGSTNYLFNYIYTKNLSAYNQNLTLTGNQIILDCSTYKFTGNLLSSIIPNTTNLYDLGNSTNYFNNGYITNIYGTLKNGSQPNITSVGTLTSLNCSGNISGTLTTNNQPNITNVGTLTSLNISCDILPSTTLINKLGSLTKMFDTTFTKYIYSGGEKLALTSTNTNTDAILIQATGNTHITGNWLTLQAINSLELIASYIAFNATTLRGWGNLTQNLGDSSFMFNYVYAKTLRSVGYNLFLQSDNGYIECNCNYAVNIKQSRSIEWWATMDINNPTGLMLNIDYYGTNRKWAQYISTPNGTDCSYVFCYSDNNNAFVDKGWISSYNSSLMNFTGQHHVKNDDEFIIDDINKYIGLIVVCTGKYSTVRDDGQPMTDKNAITINDALPIVKLSNQRKQKNIFGVISDKEDETTKRAYSFGNFSSVFPKVKNDDRLYINGCGEGAMWVVNTNNDLYNGDYIQSSNIEGYGEKQDDDIYHNYTVGKITCDCDFNLNSDIYKCEEFIYNYITYRRAFIGVIYLCS